MQCRLGNFMVWYDATEIAVTGDNVSDCAHCLLHDSPSIQTILMGGCYALDRFYFIHYP